MIRMPTDLRSDTLTLSRHLRTLSEMLRSTTSQIDATLVCLVLTSISDNLENDLADCLLLVEKAEAWEQAARVNQHEHGRTKDGAQ